MEISGSNKLDTSQFDEYEADQLYRFAKIISEKMSILVTNQEYTSLLEFLQKHTRNDSRFEQVRLVLNDVNVSKSQYSIFIESYKIGVVVLIDNRSTNAPYLPAELVETSSIDFISILKEISAKELGKVIYQKLFNVLSASRERFISSPIRLSDYALKVWRKLESEGKAINTGTLNINNQPIFEYIDKS